MAEKRLLRRLAVALSVLLMASYVALYGGLSAKILPQGAWPKSAIPAALWEWLFIMGTLVALPICAIIGLKKSRLAGALLLLASAAASIALSINAGPYLWRYFTGFFIAILPQCLIGYLLFRDGKPKKKSSPPPKKHPR
jgi:peptidoglycan/LPS O-acetylase OafA/YrhL